MQKNSKLFSLIVFVMLSFILVGKVYAGTYPFEGMVNADSLVIKDGTTSKANKITELVFGSKVTVIGESGNYYQISFDGGKIGYTSKTYVLDIKKFASTSGDYKNYCASLIKIGFV